MSDPHTVVVVEPSIAVVSTIDPSVVVETILTTEVVEVGIAGPQGQSGSIVGFRYDQAIPSAVWTINHMLGFQPNATVLDSSGRVVEGDIVYPSADTMVLSFSSAFAGSAYLS